MSEFRKKLKSSSEARLVRLHELLVTQYMSTMGRNEEKAEEIFGRSRDVELELEARSRRNGSDELVREARRRASGLQRPGPPDDSADAPA